MTAAVQELTAEKKWIETQKRFELHKPQPDYVLVILWEDLLTDIDAWIRKHFPQHR